MQGPVVLQITLRRDSQGNHWTDPSSFLVDSVTNASIMALSRIGTSVYAIPRMSWRSSGNMSVFCLT